MLLEFLEQEDGIALLKKIEVVPQRAYAKILEEDGTRYVLRQYKIQEIEGKYNKVNISFTLRINSDKIVFYSVYLTSDKTDDVICICADTNNDWLFYEILTLEENVWNRCLV